MNGEIEELRNRILYVEEPTFYNQHYEVTNYSINTLLEKYECFNDYEFKEAKSRRRQMSMPGAYLENPNKRGIDIVSDVMTPLSSIMFFEGCDESIKIKFKKIYHSAGNLLPIPEGSNAAMPGKDIYDDKLFFFKDIIEKLYRNEQIISEQEIKEVEKRIKDEKSLGTIHKEYQNDYPCFKNGQTWRYWLNMEYTNSKKSWSDIIKQYYLCDFVNDKGDIISHKNINVEDLIKMIIKRSYRIIEKNEDMDLECLEIIYSSI